MKNVTAVVVSVVLFWAPVALAENTVERAVFKAGTLAVSVKDHLGTPLPKAALKLSTAKGKAVQTLRADAKGECKIKNLEAGAYRLAVEDRLLVLLDVNEKGTVSTLVVMVPARPRYAAGGGKRGFWLSSPWIIAGLVAVAIAIPVAIHNSGGSHGHP